MPTVSLRQATGADYQGIRDLLSESGLPVDDLFPPMLEQFVVAEFGEKLVGLVGLQKFGGSGLLRSLVVSETMRGSGLGGMLVGRLESLASELGIGELWLLTIDAQHFFEKHGYGIAPREAAPPSIQTTEEFSHLCPGSAFLMRKTIPRAA